MNKTSPIISQEFVKLSIFYSVPLVSIKEALVKEMKLSGPSALLCLLGDPGTASDFPFHVCLFSRVLWQALSNGPVATNSRWLLTFLSQFYLWNSCRSSSYQIAGLTAFLTLLAAVWILQNIQLVNSIQSKIVTMFSIVLTQPMALEETQLIKFFTILYGTELHTVIELQM